MHYSQYPSIEYPPDPPSEVQRLRIISTGICEMAGNQGKLDMRISAVERKLTTMDTSLADINKSLKMILAR